MKSLQMFGKDFQGRNYGEIVAKIKESGLTDTQINQAMSRAGQLFPKKTRGKQNGTGRDRVQTKGKTNVDGITRKEMKLDGVILEIFEGPMHKVLRQVQGRPRSVVFMSVESHLTSRTATIIVLKGKVDAIAYGRIDKDALKPYFDRAGFSMLSSFKAVGDRRNGVTIHATGQNLRLPNVQAFAQAFAKIAYRGTALIGARLNGQEISTNVFLTPDTIAREAASWPMAKPDAYVVTEIGTQSVSYLGERGYVSIDKGGKVMVALFAALITAGLERLFKVAAPVPAMPWINIGALDLKQLGGEILDVAIAHTDKNDTYKVYVTGKGMIAILTVAWENNKFSLKGQPDYKEFKYEGLALLGRVNDDTVMLGNRNGGPTALEFMPVADFKEFGFLPFTAQGTSAPQAQA